MVHGLRLVFLFGSGLAARTKTTQWSELAKATIEYDENGCVGPACGSLDTTQFDFVVVGSGAGGGTVAARLAQEGHQVLMMEAGYDNGENVNYQMPVGHGKATETPGLSWNYFVEHYQDRERAALDHKWSEKGIFYPRGGTLGGSTAINAQITVKAQTNDWDRIAEITNDDGWRSSAMNHWEDILDTWLPKWTIPLSDQLEDQWNPKVNLGGLERVLSMFDSAFREIGNPISAGTDPVSKLWAYSDYLKRNVNTELRLGDVDGPYGFPQAIRDGHRWGARDRALQALAYGTLTIKTQALATRVVFSNAKAEGGCTGPCKARGVKYLNGRSLYGAEMGFSDTPSPDESEVTVRDGGEIIVSTGAFNTPQLLKQSGIGSKDELARFDLPTHVDLPGVGTNLQDRYEVVVEADVVDNENNPVNWQNAETASLAYDDWVTSGKGYYGTNGVQMSMLWHSGQTDVSDIHFFALLGQFRGYVVNYSKHPAPDYDHGSKPGNTIAWAILKGHTDNRGGTVKLRCASKVDDKCLVNPRSQPDINFHYFNEGTEFDETNPDLVDSKGERDLAAVVDAVEFVRRMNAETNSNMPGAKLVEVWPGTEFAPNEKFGSEREKLNEWVKREAWGHHASCTCPIGCIPADEVGSHNARAGVCEGSEFNVNAVLDSRFRVRGTQGLRVVDASAFPRIPGTFLLLPTYMLSEKGAATILEDHQ